MAFQPLERLINLDDGYRKVFRVAGMALLLMQTQGRRYLMVNQCPHQQHPLDQATIQDYTLTCPYHGMRFDLNSGKPHDGCNQSLRLIPLVYEGNQIGLEV